MEFYQTRIGSSQYKGYVGLQYAPFIDAIAQEVRNGGGTYQTILEVGCGMGTITDILEKKLRRRMLYDPSYLASDMDQGMVQVAGKQLGRKAIVFHADMQEATWLHSDVIHSHGSLEHLSDHDIYRTLESHAASGARVAIHYVPGEGHKQPSFGDERLMPLAWWQDKWEPDDSFAFNDGKDYCLTWRF